MDFYAILFQNYNYMDFSQKPYILSIDHNACFTLHHFMGFSATALLFVSDLFESLSSVLL